MTWARRTPMRRTAFRAKPKAEVSKGRTKGKGLITKTAIKRSAMKVGRGNPIPAKVRAEVVRRSGGHCEVGLSENEQGLPASCDLSDLEMHHLAKRPRLHEVWAILHLCKFHHYICEVEFAKGRLEPTFGWPGYELLGGDVREVVGRLGPPTYIRWAIERRERKNAPLLETLASGVIALTSVPTS